MRNVNLPKKLSFNPYVLGDKNPHLVDIIVMLANDCDVPEYMIKKVENYNKEKINEFQV